MKKGFTLAEVLITMAIIGVVAALTIPSVMVNAREQGNITAYKKALSVLNSAISLSSAMDSKGPSASSTAKELMDDIASKMNVIQGTADGCTTDCSFTTADGMTFTYMKYDSIKDENGKYPLGNYSTEGCYENGIKNDKPKTGDGACEAANWKKTTDPLDGHSDNGACTDVKPCYIVVDVDGTNGGNKFTKDFTSTTVSGSVTDRFVVAITAEGAQAATDYDKAVMAK